MAQQKGIFKITGTIGDVTFYKSKDGYLVRGKGGIDAKRIATDPAFQRTRENGMEFARAGKAGKTLRSALRPLLTNVKTTTMASRLTKIMMKVIQADAVNARGQRNVIDGEAELLTGFECNETGTLATTLHAPYTAEIDRTAGQMTLAVPSFIPANMLTAPQGTTHYKMISGAAEIDFEQETFINAVKSTEILPYNNEETATLTHTLSVTADSVHPLFLAVGVEFYQEVNGGMYALKNGSYNPMAVIMVNGGV
jgi:hypothetical protein